jgi:hypothetical protein
MGLEFIYILCIRLFIFLFFGQNFASVSRQITSNAKGQYQLVNSGRSLHSCHPRILTDITLLVVDHSPIQTQTYSNKNFSTFLKIIYIICCWNGKIIIIKKQNLGKSITNKHTSKPFTYKHTIASVISGKNQVTKKLKTKKKQKREFLISSIITIITSKIYNNILWSQKKRRVMGSSISNSIYYQP